MQHEWTFKKNCSLTPRQLGMAYGLLSLFSLLVAAVFTASGVWMILVFTVLELVVVSCMFLYHAMHATDQERIILDDGRLVFEHVDGIRRRCVQFDADRARLTPPQHPRDLITLCQQELKVEFGRFVNAEARRQVALELHALLRGRRA